MKRFLLALGFVLFGSLAFSQSLGIFTASVSIGDDNGWGLLESYDAATDTYTVLGSGNDIWGSGAADGFFFVYKEVTGDFVATCEANWGEPEQPHPTEPNGDFWKKMGIMARDAKDDPTYAGAAHVTAAIIRDLQSNLHSRKVLDGETVDDFYVEEEDLTDLTNVIQLKRELNNFTMLRQKKDGSFMELLTIEVPDISETLLVGLAVTAHNVDTIERAIFKNVSITQGQVGVTEWSMY